MRIRLTRWGSFKNKNYRELFEYYSKLATRYCKLDIVELKDRASQKINLKDIEKKFSEKGHHVCFSENGLVMDTPAMAKCFEKFKNGDSGLLHLYIGNAMGFEPEVLKKAGAVWSLSALTMNHELALVMAAEQLFRVLKLNAGGSYHH